MGRELRGSEGRGISLTVLHQCPQHPGDLQEHSCATAGVNSPVDPAIPMIPIQNVAVWGRGGKSVRDRKGQV